EHVVKVAAHVDAVGGGHVRGGDLGARDRGQLPGKQAGLQHVGDLGPAAEHAVDPDGQRQLLAELLDEAQVGDLEVPLVAAAGQGEDAVAVLAVRQRNA